LLENGPDHLRAIQDEPDLAAGYVNALIPYLTQPPEEKSWPTQAEWQS